MRYFFYVTSFEQKNEVGKLELELWDRKCVRDYGVGHWPDYWSLFEPVESAWASDYKQGAVPREL